MGLFVLFCFGKSHAQTDPLQQARIFAEQKDYQKAIELFKKLHNQNPLDAEAYNGYIATLIATKE